MKLRFGRQLVCLLFAPLLASCATSGGPIGQDPSIAVADLTVLPAPSGSEITAANAIELVRPLDVLDISVFGVEELSREEVRVGLEGYFDYPLIGAVQANGRSLAEIGHEMEVRFADSYVRNPDIQVNFVSREGQVFTIGGEVRMPGQYPIVQPTSLLEAIALGQGRSDYAQLQEVMIFREVDGQRFIGIYDVSAIQRGNYADPQIYAHDVIVVGESPSTRQLAKLTPLVPLVTSPLILLERVVRR